MFLFNFFSRLIQRISNRYFNISENVKMSKMLANVSSSKSQALYLKLSILKNMQYLIQQSFY
ncbi:hypothetical protein SAMN05421813_101161 [Daejeonella rubra]|uniref:Uncharacterized protein n=1 Tax=Daejeonella rubra TaxID=990371 RepID=A0A1G9LZ55_9SPHI|nr:hypothetical protein SAMN05421813_101161 [Daejeonella rubra]